MHKVEYVIFDMDGLMFDTENLGMLAMQEVYAKYGYTVTKDIYLELVGTNGQVSLEILQSHFGKNFPSQQLDIETHEKLDELIRKDGLPIKKGLINLLEHLKKHNIPCAIASSTNHDRVLDYLKMAKIDQYFQFIIGGNEVTKTKPFPDIFLKALQKANIEADNALVLEDSKNGILASHKAGIPVICVPDMKVHEKQINDLCLAVLPSLDEVIDLI